jgi:hypothetical protein
MSITLEGIEAEKKARVILKNLGWEVQQLDWIGKKDGKWTIFEVKIRELFNPPPFLGTGLDKRQIYLRNELLKDKDLRTMLIVFIKNTADVYWQYLDELEKGKHFDTKNDIRIYPIENFIKISDYLT